MNSSLLKIIKVFTISISLLVIISWIIILFSNEPLPEGRTELIFHIVSELIMAIACLAGGIYLYYKKNIGYLISIAGFSMLVYSTLNASGYYFNSANIYIGFLMLVPFLISGYLLIELIKFMIQSYENK